MNYEDLYDQIQEAGFTAGICVHNGVSVGIEVYSSALQLEPNVEKLRKICGDGYLYTGFPNEEMIAIKRKATK